MSNRIHAVLIALVASSALSTGAFAAINGVNHANDEGHPTSRLQMSADCSALESQYQDAAQDHQGAPGIDKASELYSQGRNLCNDNEGSAGVQKLQQALRDIGVRPQA